MKKRTTAPPLGEPVRRINVTILESQYEALSRRGLNVSGLIRDLLGDYLSAASITIEVDAETRQLYDQVIANTGCTDEDVAAELRHVLQRLLDRKLEQLAALRRELS